MVARDGSGSASASQRHFVILSEPDPRDAPVENDALNAGLKAFRHVAGKYDMGGRYTSRKVAPVDSDDSDGDDEDTDEGNDEPTDEDEEGEVHEDDDGEDDEEYDEEDDSGDDYHYDSDVDYIQDEDVSMADVADGGVGIDEDSETPARAQDSDDSSSRDSHDTYDSMLEDWAHRSRGRERRRARGQDFRGAKDSGSSAAKGDRPSSEWRGGSNRGNKGGANISSQRGRSDNQRARGLGRGGHSNGSSARSQSSNSPAYIPKPSKPKRKNSIFISDDTSSEGRGAEEDDSEEAQSTDDGNEGSSTDPIPEGALVAFEKRMNERWTQLKADREFEREIAIANGVIADPKKKTTLENAIKPVGECEDMCPEYERAERIVQKTVDRCEKPFSRSGKDKLPDERLMVKKFRRSAAGVDEQLPTDLRTPAALKRSTDYLIDRILGGSQPFASVHKFVWDRTRAIRNDITILQFTNPADVRIAIYCLERIARFHILALHKLSPEYEDEEFNAYQEREQLNSTLVALRNLYDDNRNREVSPNEAEFRAYSIMLDSSPNIEDQVQGWPRHLLRDAQVQLALKFHALGQNAAHRKGPLVPGARPNIAQENFGGYFQLLKTPAISYLMACVAEMFFNEVREMGLRNLIDGYKRRAAHDRVFTRKDLMVAFAFDSEEETQEFAEAHGIYFGVPAGPEWVHFAASNFTPDSNPARRQAFSDTYIEYKNYNRTVPEVIHAVKIVDSVNFGMYDHESDQSMGDAGTLSPEDSQSARENARALLSIPNLPPVQSARQNAGVLSSIPNLPPVQSARLDAGKLSAMLNQQPLQSTRQDAGGLSSTHHLAPFQPSNSPFSRPSFGFNPSATSFVPPTAANPSPASPSYGVPGAGALATPTTAPSGLPYHASPSPLFKPPGSAALGGSFPSFGVSGSATPSDSIALSSFGLSGSASAAPSSPFPSFGVPGSSAPPDPTPSFGVSGSTTSSSPFLPFGVPGSAAPSGSGAASSTEPKTKHVSFTDSHGVTAPSQPPWTSFPGLARSTSVLSAGSSSQSPGASNPLATFSWSKPTPAPSSNPNAFPAPAAASAPPPTFTVTPPLQPPSSPSFTPNVLSLTNLGAGTGPSSAPPSSQSPRNSFGSFPSQPPAPPSLLSGPPSQPPGSPFEALGPSSQSSRPPSQPPGSPSQVPGPPPQSPGSSLQLSRPPSQPPEPPSRPILPPSLSLAEIKRQQDVVLHQTVSTYFVQNNGIFEQLVEVQAAPIIEDVMRELHQERVSQKWQKIRSRYLALKYGPLWRTKAYVMFRQRTSRDRRERMRKLREAGIKQRREALEKQKAREARQAAKTAKAAETNGIEEVRVRAESHTPPHHMAQFQTSPPGGVSSEPNRKRNHITFSEQVRMLKVVKDALQPEKAEERRRHKRAKTLDNPHPQREFFHDDGIEYERMPNGSWTRKIHNPWAHKYKLNWTKTDYFKCKAMGIDPNTPMIPPSFRTLEKMDKKKRAADDSAGAGSPTNKFQKVSSNGRRASGPQIVDNVDDDDYSKYTPQRKPSPERSSWSPDEDPIIMESRRLRALMAEDEAAMRAERLEYEKELNEASIKGLRPAPQPSNGHGSPSSRQPRPYVPTMSRTEQRIARTGAHGLAYKPVSWKQPSPGPPRRPSHPQPSFSQPSFGDDSGYENYGNGNGGGSYGIGGMNSQGPSAGPSTAATPATGVDGTSADNAFCLDSD